MYKVELTDNERFYMTVGILEETWPGAWGVFINEGGETIWDSLGNEDDLCAIFDLSTEDYFEKYAFWDQDERWLEIAPNYMGEEIEDNVLTIGERLHVPAGPTINFNGSVVINNYIGDSTSGDTTYGVD